MSKTFIFRNYTIEYIFGNKIDYSGYTFTNINLDSYYEILWLYFSPINSDVDSTLLEIDDYIQQFKLTFQNLNTNKPIYVFLMNDFVVTTPFAKKQIALKEKIAEYNSLLIEYSKLNTNIYAFDLNEFLLNNSNNQIIDYKYYYSSKSFLNPKLKSEFLSWVHLKISCCNFNRKKCLVLDFDNTLWGGILGEDGIFGRKCGGDFPGNVFSDFQKMIIELSKSGVILAACSKNNITDVQELWDNNESILLKQDYFIVKKINWQSKSTNIIEIAEELNIGLDSVVFIDDNPVERELVKSTLPMVQVPDFPKHSWEIPSFFGKVIDQYFKIYNYNESDLKKHDQYQQNNNRKELLNNVGSVDEYLNNLNTIITIDHLNDSNFSRIAQMTQKTNQFNLTTKRYTEAEILETKGHRVHFCLSCSDKFGDAGITALCIINIENDLAHFDVFLMSCRILGRKIEDYFMKFILNNLYNKGVKTVTSEYIKTNKNIQVENYYLNSGFYEVSKTESNTIYKKELNNLIEIDDKIKIIYNEK